MKRRGFLKLLGLLPFVPALAEVAAKTIKKPPLLRVPNYIGIDQAVTGSDQSSIWLVEWGKAPGKSMTMMECAKGYRYNHLPVVEYLSQRNPLLQDMVWKEPAPRGWNINHGSKIRYMPTRRGS